MSGVELVDEAVEVTSDVVVVVVGDVVVYGVRSIGGRSLGSIVIWIVLFCKLS